jgi:diguanylate cyclase (GGDEF)-like protein
MLSPSVPEIPTAVVRTPVRGLAPQVKDRHLLIRVSGSRRGQVVRVFPMPSVVGRHSECEIWLDDDGVSRRHARIVPAGDGFAVQDLGSANGTFIAGMRVTYHALSDGDVIHFGPSASFRYTLTDQTQEELARQLYEASVTDPLTGAHNRDHFDTRLKGEMSFSMRHKTNLSIVMLDVDHFKAVNDTHGHHAGDLVLAAVARLVMNSLRLEDVFARYGGEEFAMILRGVDIKGAMATAERLRRGIEALRVQSEHVELQVTVSAGAAALDELENKSAEAFMALGDRRLYAAKHRGRNRVVGRE